MNTLMKNVVLAPFNMLYRVSPELCLRILFRLKQGRGLDLNNPTTFNEKLQWLKLHYRNPLMSVCSDKYEVGQFVKERGCGDILNELYWQGFDPKEIPYNYLPDSFVIKVTHGSTFNIIVRDKTTLDRRSATEKLTLWLHTRFIPCHGEWFYGKVGPRIVVERFLDDGSGSSLCDYKVFCFGACPVSCRSIRTGARLAIRTSTIPSGTTFPNSRGATRGAASRLRGRRVSISCSLPLESCRRGSRTRGFFHRGESPFSERLPSPRGLVSQSSERRNWMILWARGLSFHLSDALAFEENFETRDGAS